MIPSTKLEIFSRVSSLGFPSVSPASSGCRRVSLYRMLSKSGHPALEKVMSILNAAGIQFRVVPKAGVRHHRKAA